MNILRIAWQGVSGFKLRMLLAVIALSASVVGVVSVAAASTTVEATVLQQAILQNGPSTTVDVTGLSGSAGLKESAVLAGKLQRSYGPTSTVARVASLEAIILIIDDRASNVNVDFTNASLRAIRPFPVLQGRWLEVSDKVPFALEVVLNQPGAEELNVDPGRTLQMVSLGVETPTLVRVVGVVDDGSDSPNAYVEISSADEFLESNSQHLTVTIKMAGGTVQREGVNTRLSQWATWSASSYDLDVQRKDTVNALRAEVEATRATFVVVGLIGLLASISAIANIGLSTLRERGSELTLRRALGAKRWHIPLIMIVESQIVALISAAIAIPLSWLLYPAIFSQFGAPYGISSPPYPWEFAALGLVVGLLTSLLGSLAPAMFALNVRISNVMRE